MIINGLKNNKDHIANLLRQGNIGVVPTDTIYGLSCLAQNKISVENIYKIKRREKDKPFIILIDSVIRLGGFDINLDEPYIKILKRLWPNKVSVILKCNEPKYEYLHRGTNQLSFRIPDHPELLNLLSVAGPLVSTSANISGKEPVSNIKDARKMFSTRVDFYVDEGVLTSKPTTVLKLNGDKFEIVRQGDYIVNPLMLKY